MIRKISRLFALVAGVGILVAGNSISAMAATAIPAGQSTLGVDSTGRIVDGGNVLNFDTNSASGAGSVGSISLSGSTITIEDLNMDGCLSVWQPGYTIVFSGTNSIQMFADDQTCILDVANGSSLTVAQWITMGNVTIQSGVTSNPATPVSNQRVVFSGASSSSSSSSSAAPVNSLEDNFVERMYEDINQTANEVALAVQGMNFDGSANPAKIVECEGGALNGIIMNSMTKAPGVTLFFDYNYAGYRFRSAITPELAAQYFSTDIPWYGPCYIAERFPTVMTGPAL